MESQVAKLFAPVLACLNMEVLGEIIHPTLAEWKEKSAFL